MQILHENRHQNAPGMFTMDLTKLGSVRLPFAAIFLHSFNYNLYTYCFLLDYHFHN